jgi:hypothetical protein
MPWIEALKYGLIGLAALLGLWAVTRARAPMQVPGASELRAIKRLVGLAVLLVLLSGMVAAYEDHLVRSSRRQMHAILARMDQTIGDKLNVDSDAFALVDAYSKQILDNMMRQLCRDVIDLSRRARSEAADHCRARLQRSPVDASG